MRIIYFLFVFALAGIFLTGSSSGPANIQGLDRTGSPLSEGACTVCHGTANFDPSLDVKVLDGDTEVTTYAAGETYTLQVTINNNGASVFGFQATALSGDDDVKAGSFTAPTGTQVVPLNGRDYIEHSSPNDNNVFEVDWTAPASGVGDIRFYVAGVAANGGGTNGSDGAAFLETPLTLADISVGTNDLPELAAELSVFPNPVSDLLNVEVKVEAAVDTDLRLVNAAGQVLIRQQRELFQGQNEWSLNLENLPAGHYWLELSNGQSASRTAVLKK